MRTSLLDEALDEAINEALDAAVQGHARLTPLQEMFPPDPELEAWRKEPTPPPLPPIASLKRRPSPTIKEEVAGDELPLHATEDNGIGPNTLPRMLTRSLEDPSLYRISEKDVVEGHPLPMPKSEQESLERHIPRDPEDIEPKLYSLFPDGCTHPKCACHGILPPGHRPNSGQDLTKDEVYTKPDGTIATRPREIKVLYYDIPVRKPLPKPDNAEPGGSGGHRVGVVSALLAEGGPSQSGRKIGVAPAVIVQESDKHRRKHGSGKKEGERTRRKDSSRKGKGKGKEKDIQEELETTTVQVVREVRGGMSIASLLSDEPFDYTKIVDSFMPSTQPLFLSPNTAATTLPTPPPSTASSDASFTGTQDENSPEEPEAPSSSRSDETFRERPSPTVDSPERPNLPIEPSPEEVETNQITESAGRSPLPAMDDHSLSSEEDSHPSSAPDSMDVDEPPPPITVEAPWTNDMMDVDQPPPITTHQPQQHPIEHEDEDSQTILYHQPDANTEVDNLNLASPLPDDWPEVSSFPQPEHPLPSTDASYPHSHYTESPGGSSQGAPHTRIFMNPPRIQINPALNYQAGEPIWGPVPGQRVLYHPPPSASAEDVMMHGEPHPIHTAYHLPPAEHNHAPVHHPHFPASLPPFAFSHSNSPSTSSSSYTLPSLPHILIPHGNQALAGTSRMQTKQLPSSDFEASADIRLPTIDESKPDFTDPSSASTSSSPNKAAKPRAPKASTGAPKPFKCEFPGCNATFTRKNDVQRHMKSASAHRNFEQEAKGDFDDKKCPRCGRILSREDSARRHFESGACGKRELPSEQVLKGKRVAGGPKAVQDTNSRSRSRT